MNSFLFPDKKNGMENLITAFSEYSAAEGLDMPTFMALLKEIFGTLIKRHFGIYENFHIINNPERGDFQILWERIIVPDEDFTDFRREIMLSKAIMIEADYEEGEYASEIFPVSELGSNIMEEAHGFFIKRLSDIKSHRLAARYHHYIGQMIVGEVISYKKSEAILISEYGDIMVLPRPEQIPGEFFRKGEYIRVILSNIGFREEQAVLLVSRIHDNFLVQLLSYEIHEIFHGIIRIHSLARIPGVRCKVILISTDERIDPIAASVGAKGQKISRIVRELRKESIDLIAYTDDFRVLISKLLEPAIIDKVELDYNKKSADIYLDYRQINAAVGPAGSNLRLVSCLTGYTIDLYCEEQIPVAEDPTFINSLGNIISCQVIDELCRIGCDTVGQVMSLSVSDLIARTDIDEQTILNLRRILGNR
jgi:N utilization substance protein A